MILKMNREEAIQWCKRNPNVVIQGEHNSAGISWNGTEMRFWNFRENQGKLRGYGWNINEWKVAPWSPVQARRPVVGGI